MSELNYKELQEQGVFDVPYRAFEFMRTQQTKIDQLNAELALCREENKGLVGKVSWMQGQVLELEAKHKTKNERIMKLVSLFTSLSSQILCEEPELSDDFYKKFDEFHSVLISIEL